MLRRIFPDQFDNRFEGRKAALWLLGGLVALKLVMSLNSIFNTASVAAGADGLPLATYGAAAAQAVLMLFAIMSLGQLALAGLGLLALVRYRAMVPFIYALLLFEHAGRRIIIRAYDVERSQAVQAGAYVNMALLALLIVGLVLSLWPRPSGGRGRA